MSDIREDQTIWFPGIYSGRETEEYTQSARNLDPEDVYVLVKQRAHEDGEWAIANGCVGPYKENEPKMRRMMAFVSDEKNILQALDHMILSGIDQSVDYICRDLANASKWAANLKR